VATCISALANPECANGIDDDGDLLVDAADPGCTDAGDAFEKAPFTLRDNGLDDDGDGWADMLDPECISPYDVSEVPEPSRALMLMAGAVMLGWLERRCSER
jgi:hypothetical protein